MVCEMIYVKGCITISVVSTDRCKKEGLVEIWVEDKVDMVRTVSGVQSQEER